MSSFTTDSPEAPAATHVRRRAPIVVNLWLLLLGDILFIASLFGAYMHSTSQEPLLFNSSQRTIVTTSSAASILVLVASSLFVFVGTRAAGARKAHVSAAAISAAIGCAIAFCALKLHEYQQVLLQRLSPRTNAYFTYYFIFGGVHWCHVIVGVGALGYMLRLTLTSPHSRSQLSRLSGGACLWHLTVLFGVVLFALLYLPS